jgi:uncharacterized protein YggU (UPF0235/DUF167 family)
VRVSAAPEHGRANDAVLDLLATKLSVPRRHVTLVAGHGARDKVVQLEGIEEEETLRRLESGTE